MILIADSGSTKCDWSLIQNKEVVKEFHTQGFNPFFHSVAEIVSGLQKETGLSRLGEKITLIRYLGTGCSTPEKRNIVERALARVFTKAEIIVEHDLLGAAYATYQGQPAITAILGTGSNSCFFDGENLIQKSPSLGFIMGDEGGGGYFGKKLVTSFCYGKLSKKVSLDFENTFQLSISDLVHRVNSEPHANVFLAGFMPFINKHKNDPTVEILLSEGMNKFVVNHILPLPNATEVSIHFVGSVAHFFTHSIENALSKHNLKMGQVIQKPGARVVDYFLKYGL